MSISMYQASVPVFVTMLGNLQAILLKGAAHADAKKFDPAALINSRLFPDMFPLSRQVQIAADMAKFCPSRLAGVDAPKYEDIETTFAQLVERIDKTIAYIKTFKPGQIDGTEEKAITLNTPRGALNFNGQQYLLHFALPNFYFHVTTAYNLLRHGGVELGKPDFIGRT
jgi:hypothetical protein